MGLMGITTSALAATQVRSKGSAMALEPERHFLCYLYSALRALAGWEGGLFVCKTYIFSIS